MRALSVCPFMGTGIIFADKCVECRTWDTNYRGDLLICTTQRREVAGIAGHAVAVVRIAETHPFTEGDIEPAWMESMPERPSYAWTLDDLRLIKPFPVKGRQHFFNVPDELVDVVAHVDPYDPDYEEFARTISTYYRPLVYTRGDPDVIALWDTSRLVG